ncbi:MAG: biotin synthase BioB [Candidatus Omnitrophica bacterium]|nr:biotin synthase BioB [Candidatus Omnitrophota bacterium]
MHGKVLSVPEALRVLDLREFETLSLLNAAFEVRQSYFGRTVAVHVLNNVQNGLCPEDCRYCAQSKLSRAGIKKYAMKSDKEIFKEARAAHKQGAFRYCLVFSGTGPSDDRVSKLTGIIREIKKRWPLEVCVSPGVINYEQAQKLKKAGLDRLNHNLNTSLRHYQHICTTHSYEDRLKTLASAKSAGLKVCSGVIIGMGESKDDVVAMAKSLQELKADSIPVNFFIPMPGLPLKKAVGLTPDYCLRVLCLFRFLNPAAEIRMAAGRELHLRHLEPLGLYAANSLFLQGYLNAKGSSNRRTLQMIKDLGFSILSEIKLDDLLDKEEDRKAAGGVLKGLKELRPFKRHRQ